MDILGLQPGNVRGCWWKEAPLSHSIACTALVLMLVPKSNKLVEIGPSQLKWAIGSKATPFACRLAFPEENFEILTGSAKRLIFVWEKGTIFRSARASWNTSVRPLVSPSARKIWITYIQAYMPQESSEDSSNQPDGPMGSPKCPPWPLGTPPPSTPNDP